MPFLGTTDGTEPGIVAWTEKIANLDGYVFIVQKYNYSIMRALKKALDIANREARGNKAAGIVSYGGARAAEHLRGIFVELQIAGVKGHPTLSLFTDFENFITFRPADVHFDNVNLMLEAVHSNHEIITRIDRRN